MLTTHVDFANFASWQRNPQDAYYQQVGAWTATRYGYAVVRLCGVQYVMTYKLKP